MNKVINQLKEQKIVIVVMIATMIFALIFNQYYKKDYSMYDNTDIEYVSVQVTEIIDEKLEYNSDIKMNLGTQTLKVKVLEGKHKNEVLTVNNFVSKEHYILAKLGTKLIVSIDEPDGIAPYYYVYNYDRTAGLGIFMIILFMIVCCIGKGKGVKSILGLAYSLYAVVYLLLPTVFSGYSPILMTINVIALSTIVTLLLLNGECKKTYSAILATILGVGISAVFFYLLSVVFHLNGFNSEESEALILISQFTQLKVKDVLFAGVLISSLGAIMDVAMSIVSSLFEIHYHKPELTVHQLINSGIEIGKDMIGTMTNTLILAFTGSSFVTLLIFLSYDLSMNQLLSSDFVAIEFAQGIAGTLGIVLTVPIAAIISGYYLKFEGKKKSQ